MAKRSRARRPTRTGTPKKPAAGRSAAAALADVPLFQALLSNKPGGADANRADLLEAMFEQTTDGIAIWDAQGRVVFVNPAARRFAAVEAVGTDLEHTPTNVWGEWFDEGERQLPVDSWPIVRALRGEAIATAEMYHRASDGTRNCVLLAAAPLRDAAGTIIGAIATTSDITDRKRSEEQAQARNRELDERLRARTEALEQVRHDLDREVRKHREAEQLLERSRGMLQAILNRSRAVIYVKDTAFRYLLINHLFEKLFDVRNEQIAGRTDYDVFPDEVAARVRANDERVLTTGESLQFEEVVPQANGNHTYVSLKFPLRDDSGAVYAVCGISADITERQEMEAELRRSQAMLAAVIDSSTDGIFSVDREYRLMTCNAVVVRLATSLLGRVPRPGASLRPGMPADLADRWYEMIDRALTGERFSVEEAQLMADGVHVFLVSLNPIVSDEGITGVTVFAKDITELKRAEERARQHQAELAHVLRVQTIGEMAASLAHEINQPLGAIASYAQGCRRRLESGTCTLEELLRPIEEIAREALRAGEITRRVRTLLRKDVPSRAPADVNEIVAAAFGIAAPAAREHAVTLRFFQGAFLPKVEVDAIQIEQVVLNLLVNAIEAIASDASARQVEVRTARAGEHTVEVAVRDSGRGLAAAELEQIFEPFLTTKPNGLGMGLAISRSIVEAHGGDLSAVPNPDGGCTFRFILPVAGGA